LALTVLVFSFFSSSGPPLDGSTMGRSDTALALALTILVFSFFSSSGPPLDGSTMGRSDTALALALTILVFSFFSSSGPPLDGSTMGRSDTAFSLMGGPISAGSTWISTATGPILADLSSSLSFSLMGGPISAGSTFPVPPPVTVIEGAAEAAEAVAAKQKTAITIFLSRSMVNLGWLAGWLVGWLVDWLAVWL